MRFRVSTAAAPVEGKVSVVGCCNENGVQKSKGLADLNSWQWEHRSACCSENYRIGLTTPINMAVPSLGQNEEVMTLQRFRCVMNFSLVGKLYFNSTIQLAIC